MMITLTYNKDDDDDSSSSTPRIPFRPRCGLIDYLLRVAGVSCIKSERIICSAIFSHYPTFTVIALPQIFREKHRG